MSKFHIGKTGKPEVCKANTRNCPLGSSKEHFSNKEEAQHYADELNELTVIADEYSSGKRNKPHEVFTNTRPVETNIKRTKKKIDKHENHLWKEKFKKAYTENILNPPNEQEFKKDYFNKNKDYLRAKKEYDKALSYKGVVINERIYICKLLSKLNVKPLKISFSNASSSTYLVFKDSDREKVENFFLKASDDEEIKSFHKQLKRNKVFSVRIADHAKHKSKYNNTVVDYSLMLNNDIFTKNSHKQKLHKKGLEELKRISINLFK